MVDKHPGQDWSLLTERLYRKYLKKEELENAASLMDEVKVVLLSVPSLSVKWDGSMQNYGTTCLDLKKEYLGEIFLRFFDLFFKAKTSALSFFDEFGIYQPVKITISSMPEFIIEKKRPLEEYDFLRGDEKPFWLR